MWDVKLYKEKLLEFISFSLSLFKDMLVSVYKMRKFFFRF